MNIKKTESRTSIKIWDLHELQKVTLKEMHWLCDGLSLNPQGAFKERHPKIIV